MTKKELLLKFGFLKTPILGQLRYHELNNLRYISKCLNPQCNNEVSWYKNRYRTFCSPKCANSNNDAILKRKNTSIEKYGVSCPLLSEEIKLKSKEKILAKFGVDHPMQSKEIRIQLKNTNLERYGVEYPNQNPSIISELPSVL